MLYSNKIGGNHDTVNARPDHRCLFLAASEQHGYFTTAQARECGFSWGLLSAGVKGSKYLRSRRGVYRLRDYPYGTRESVVEAWLAAGKERAVVLHESALDLLDLSVVIPYATHLTVPRTKQYLNLGPDVVIHTVSQPLRQDEVTTREGIRITSTVRSILDAAEMGTAPEQMEMAIRQADRRGLATADQFAAASLKNSLRVQQVVRRSISTMST